jgi:hypothetical protein
MQIPRPYVCRPGASRSNPAGGNRRDKPASRSGCEPDSASLHKAKAANLPELLKPAIDEEATSKSTRRAFRGDWGQRAGKDQSRILGDPAGGAGNQANGPRESITEGTAWPGVGEAHIS